MVRRKPRWEGGRGRADGPPQRPRRPRPPRSDEGGLIARLDRLESVVKAIAARLGIEAPEVGRGAMQRSEARKDGAPGSWARREPKATDAHAVVRTVARRLAGRVKTYHPERGYGFVVSPDTPGDVFFHRSDCRTDPGGLEASATVTFDLVEMANGQSKAVNVAKA
jgi:cold shock CspA family protein